MFTKNGMCLMAVAVALFVAGTVQAAYIAYNDFSDASGTGSSGNVTSYRLGGTTSGVLKDYASGASTGVTLTVGGTYSFMDNGGGNASGGLALTLFGNAVAPNLNETGRLGGASNTSMTLTFTGLAPAGRYDFGLYVGDYPAANREKMVLSGVDSFTNTSSPVMTQSTTTLPNDTTTYLGVGGDGNSAFRYSSIDPGADGAFAITITGLDSGFPMPLVAAMRLEQTSIEQGDIPEPATLALLGLAGAGLASYTRRRRG